MSDNQPELPSPENKPQSPHKVLVLFDQLKTPDITVDAIRSIISRAIGLIQEDFPTLRPNEVVPFIEGLMFMSRELPGQDTQKLMVAMDEWDLGRLKKKYEAFINSVRPEFINAYTADIKALLSNDEVAYNYIQALKRMARVYIKHLMSPGLQGLTSEFKIPDNSHSEMVSEVLDSVLGHRDNGDIPVPEYQAQRIISLLAPLETAVRENYQDIGFLEKVYSAIEFITREWITYENKKEGILSLQNKFLQITLHVVNIYELLLRSAINFETKREERSGVEVRIQSFLSTAKKAYAEEVYDISLDNDINAYEAILAEIDNLDGDNRLITNRVKKLITDIAKKALGYIGSQEEAYLKSVGINNYADYYHSLIQKYGTGEEQ